MERKERPKILINRKWPKANYTIGRLFVDGVFWFNTLEDTDRDLYQDMSVEDIKARKVYSKTAIPKGTYEVVLAPTTRFKDRPWAKRYDGLVPLLKNVKCFSGVLFHPGNGPEDTSGCILVGNNTVVGGLTGSTAAYYRLMDNVFMPAHRAGKSVFVQII